ncbi:MAG: hypothetical protein O3A29_18380 [Planctomycetota bacterium]|nr:hypothetical protein [Planctomycetota bacterium]
MRLEEFQTEYFAQSSPLDKLKKRSPKRRWNEVRRDDRSARREKDDQAPGKLNGNADQPVPLPEEDGDGTRSEPQTVTGEPVENSTNDANGNSTVPEKTLSNEADDIITKPRATTRNSLNNEVKPLYDEEVGLPESDTTEVLPVPEPSSSPAIAQQPVSGGYQEPITSPAELKSIKAIMPFRNYEPDAILAADDPCNNLCPRPDGTPCEPSPDRRTPECPEEITLGELQFGGRAFDASCYLWEPSNIFYHPLYFQDANLERYGQTYHDVLQPFVSVGRFGVQLVGLPYQMVISQPCSKVYPLGYYRPGDCAPKRVSQIPWNAKAALFQAEVVTGAIFLFP